MITMLMQFYLLIIFLWSVVIWAKEQKKDRVKGVLLSAWVYIGGFIIFWFVAGWVPYLIVQLNR